MEIKNPGYFGNLLHEQGFKVWAKYMFKIIRKTNFIEEKLHSGLFEVFQDVYDQKSIRDTINVPPRSGKTTLAIYFVAYALAKNPKCNFIYTSFSQDLLGDISRDLANILNHPVYKAMYDNSFIEEDEESEAIDDFWKNYLLENQKKARFTNRKIITEQGGVILFASIGSAITGFGAGIRGAKIFGGNMFIDDANKPDDIRSQLMRLKVQSYFTMTLLSRMNDSNVAIINIQQRLHLGDLSGFLKSEYGFRVLKRSLIVDGVCQLPSQYSPKRVVEVQKDDFVFVSQYQQEPILEGGNLFKREVIRELTREQMPNESDYDYRFITADLSYKDKESNDYTVFSYWGVKMEVINIRERPHLYLIDVKRKKINAVDVDNWIEGWTLQKITYGFRYIWIEDKSHGIYLNQSYRKKGYPVPTEELLKETLPRDRDKVMRANNIIPCYDNISPNLTFCTDIEGYYDSSIDSIDSVDKGGGIRTEVLAFPDSKNDDFVDTLIDASRIALLETRVSILDVL